MDIARNEDRGPRARERHWDAAVDLVRKTRGKVERARREAAQSSSESIANVRSKAAAERRDLERSSADERRDRIDIAPESLARIRALLAEESDPSRANVERLTEAYRNGDLFTPERLERAAKRLLEGGAPNGGAAV